MKFNVVGKNIEVTDAIRNYAISKLTKLEKYFSDEGIETRVLVRTYNVGTKVEVTIFAHDATLRAEVRNDDLYAAIDLVVDKLEGQMRKIKTKFEKKRREQGKDRDIDYDKLNPAAEELVATKGKIKVLGKIVKEKDIAIKEMSADDAIFQMEALGHSFFIYIDEDDHDIHVVYKRYDENYGKLNLTEENEIDED